MNEIPTCCGEIIGVERTDWYDGVAYWECLKCGESFPRMDPPSGRFLALWERRLAELPLIGRPAATPAVFGIPVQVRESCPVDAAIVEQDGKPVAAMPLLTPAPEAETNGE